MPFYHQPGGFHIKAVALSERLPMRLQNTSSSSVLTIDCPLSEAQVLMLLQKMRS